MKWKEIYEKYKNRENEEIEEIISDFSLKSSVKNFWNNYKKTIIIVCIIMMILLIVTFHKNLETLLYVFLLFLILVLSSMFFLRFSITAKSKIVRIYYNGTEIKIPYDKIKNIYLKENKERIFFKKFYFYSIIILYQTPNNNICDIILPTTFVNKKDFIRCLDKIKTKKSKINYQKKSNDYKRKRFLRKIIILLILTLIAIIGIFFTNLIA